MSNDFNPAFGPTKEDFAKAERTVTVTYSAEIPEMVLHNILCTAIEGGSSYWAEGKAVREPKDSERYKQGFFYVSCEFFDFEHDSIMNHEPAPGGVVTIPMVAKGIQNILQPSFQCNDETKRTCLKLIVDPENADYDADDADSIIQAALFNELVYG